MSDIGRVCKPFLTVRTGLPLAWCRSVAKNAIDMFLVMGMCDDASVKMLRNDKDTIARVIRSAAAVNEAFITDFQKPFAHHTEEYYRTFANNWIVMDDISSYLKKVRC